MAYAVSKISMGADAECTAEGKTSMQLLVLKPGQTPFKCGICGFSFSTNKELLCHVEAYSCCKPFQCGYCQVSYNSNTLLLLHIKLHRLFILVPGAKPTELKSDSISSVSNKLTGSTVIPSNKVNIVCTELSIASQERCVSSSSGVMSVSTSGADRHGQVTNTFSSISLEMTTEDVQSNSVDMNECHDDDAEHDTGKENEAYHAVGLLSALSANSRRKELSAQIPDCSDSDQAVHCNSAASLFSQSGNHPTVDNETEDGFFKCGDCGSIFSSARNLNDHWKSCHSACTVCRQIYPDAPKRYTHCLIDHGMVSVLEKPLLCALCGASFATARSVYDHVRHIHTKPKRQAASHSRSKERKQAKLGQIHSSQDCIEMFKCVECDSVFKSSQVLVYHWELHHSKCPDCEERFFQPKERFKHLALKHYKVSSTKPFMCVVCGAYFTCSISLARHAQSRHMENSSSSLQQVVMSESVQSAESSQSHQSVESVESQQPTKCDSDQCAVESLESQLSEVPFPNENPVECTPDEQPSVFVNESEISVKLFKCDECADEFGSVPQLLAHWHSNHSGCSVCGKRFGRPGDRYRHFQANHDIGKFKRFLCALCGAKFPLTRYLSDHVQNVHRKRMNKDQPCCSSSDPSEGNKRSYCTELYGEGGDDQCEGVETNKTGNINAESIVAPSSSHQGHDSDNLGNLCYVCGQCNYIFKFSEDLAAHWKSVHSACTVCTEIFSEPCILWQHSEINHDNMNKSTSDRPFTCAVCKETFGKVSALKEHIQSSHQENTHGNLTNTGYKTTDYSFQCGECGAFFKTTGKLSHHWRSCHQRCSMCGECYKLPDLMDQHLESKHDYPKVSAKPFVCAICGQQSGLASSLMTHMRNKHKAQIIEGKMLITESAITTKKVTVRKGQRGRAKYATKDGFEICHICGKRLKGDMKSHMLVHSEERPYPCTLCDKAYKTKVMLAIHMKTHTKEKPFVCDICGKSFMRKNALTYHTNTHTNARPYKCKVCDVGFNHPVKLRAHQRQHNGIVKEKCPLPCPVCGKIIIAQNHKRHMLLHSDKMPFSCRICDKTFRNWGDRKYHMDHTHKSKEASVIVD